MESMSLSRISKWKCLFCGSRQKKKIDIYGKSDRKIGYAIQCCNCGHVDRFAQTQSGIELIVAGDYTKVDSIDITCGLECEEYKGYCNVNSCSYHRFKETNDEIKESGIIPHSIAGKTQLENIPIQRL